MSENEPSSGGRRWSPFAGPAVRAHNQDAGWDIVVDAPPKVDKLEQLRKVKAGVYSEHSDMPSETLRDADRSVMFKKVRVHKKRAQRPVDKEDYHEMLDRRIAEIVPGLANLSVSESALYADAQKQAATELRQGFDSKYNPELVKQHKKDEGIHIQLNELKDIYDFTKPHPVDNQVPEGYEQKQRPVPRSVRLSWYQQNMVQYLRFLQSKNIWYYRDRMNIPRGPCPAHVLRECWTHGIIDENTLVWGQGLFDWLPAKNVKLLIPTIRTFEVRLGAWMKRTFSLRPALNAIRERRREHRAPEAYINQVDRMQ